MRLRNIPQHIKGKKTFLMPLTRHFAIILVLFSICSAILIGYSSFSYIKIQNQFLNNSLVSYSAQLAKSAREAYESYENICYSVAYNQVVLSYLSASDSQQQFNQLDQLESLLTNSAILNPYIVDIAIYGRQNTFVSLCGATESYKPLADGLAESRFPFMSVGTSTINRINCHILAIPIYSTGTGQSNYLGILFLAIDVNNLLNSSLNAVSSSYNPQIVFMDSQDQLMCGDETIYTALLQEDATDDFFTLPIEEQGAGTFVVTKYTVPSIDHTLYVLLDKTALSMQVNNITFRLIASMVALVMVILLLLLLLYRPTIKSLKTLTDYMKSIAAGNRKLFNQGASISQGPLGSTEIDEISRAFNDMLLNTDQLNHTIFDTYTQMYELEASNRRTKIAFLRSQINPHFLYNTLTMICGMAAEGNTDQIIDITSALSQIFRYSIKGSDLVTLREEMEIVRSYLMIQEARFGDRIHIRYEFEEASLDCLVPRMVIQPLVENAIVHGLEKSMKPGELLIGAGQNPQRGYMAIWVFDTGLGMSPEKLAQLRKAIAEYKLPKADACMPDPSKMEERLQDSVGIMNVNSRMVLYYGSAYSLVIDSEIGVGTNVQLRVPYQTAAPIPDDFPS